jgi:hypothetical protein
MDADAQLQDYRNRPVGASGNEFMYYSISNVNHGAPRRMNYFEIQDINYCAADERQ